MEDVAEQVGALVRGAVEDHGLELVHIEYLSQKARLLLRVYIDKSGGVTLEDCQIVSRQVGLLLDVKDLISGHYVLEVSSPGLDRPLFSEHDYLKFSGREIRLVTREKIESRRKFTGLIQDLCNGVLQLNCNDKIYQIPFGMISKANLVYRFSNSSQKQTQF